MKKLFLPISILLGCVIIGGFFYSIQIKKQESIEKQQEIKLAFDRQIEEMKVEEEKTDQIFTNNLKCQALLKELKQRWNNVVGIYYSELDNTCIVKYTKLGKTEESPIEDMQDSD